VSGHDIVDLKYKVTSTMKAHVEWLESIGMVVNVNKTEAVLFGKDVSDVSLVLEVKGSSFVTKSNMKVLGVLFDNQLKWHTHVDSVVKKAKRITQGLRVLRRNLGAESFLSILTAQLYSKIYYGSAVWMSSLQTKDLKRLDSIHYNALRIAHGASYSNRPISREILDHDYCRATPQEWAKYSTARELIRIYKNRVPPSLHESLGLQAYLIKRPPSVRFFDNSKSLVGRQCFPNKVASLSAHLTFNWYFQNMSNDCIRKNLKQCLFKYPSSASASIIPGAMILRREKTFGKQKIRGREPI
jgi:hypothetical protein